MNKTNRAPAPQSPFVAALTTAIADTVRELRKDGTTSMSEACLRQAVRAPSHLLAGAPIGTNAAYYYVEIFSQVCRSSAVRNFITA